MKVDLDTPELVAWISHWNGLIDADWKAKGYTHGSPPRVTAAHVLKVPGRLRILFSSGAAGFIDRETGDILYAASYSKPAKHVRGNLFSPTGGREAISYSAYGLRMLR